MLSTKLMQTSETNNHSIFGTGIFPKTVQRREPDPDKKHFFSKRNGSTTSEAEILSPHLK